MIKPGWSVAEVAERWGMNHNHVRRLIDAGELRALDLSRPGSRRKHMRILWADLLEFEQRRERKPATPKPARQPRREEVYEWIK